MSELKKVGVFGSVANTVKSSALGVEVIAAGFTEAALLSLFKIQSAADEEVKESKPDSSWQIERTNALMLARSSFK
jgi:hypothetical protein